MGRETDVPACEPFRKLVRIEPLAVVLDDQDDLTVFVPESNPLADLLANPASGRFQGYSDCREREDGAILRAEDARRPMR